MKQYRITAENIAADSPDDCFLRADDPIHDLKIASYMGGLGSEERLREYKAINAEENKVNSVARTGNDNAQIMREQNIKSGTKEWFQLWFGQKG